MECKKVQDRLLTEYLDKELGAEERSGIEEHLSGCAHCREFFEAVQKSAVVPFKTAGTLQPDSAVWQRIRAQLEAERERSHGGFWKLVDSLVSRLAIFARPLWGILRPLPLMRAAFVTALILVVVALAQWPSGYVHPAYAYVEEQMTFMGELGSGNTDLMNGDLKEYDTALEVLGG